jgi:hypothetical protein
MLFFYPVNRFQAIVTLREDLFAESFSFVAEIVWLSLLQLSLISLFNFSTSSPVVSVVTRPAGFFTQKIWQGPLVFFEELVLRFPDVEASSNYCVRIEIGVLLHYKEGMICKHFQATVLACF